MALLDIIIPSCPVVINQAVVDKPQVTIDVFGLNTEDFVYLVDGYKTILASIILRNAKEDLKNVETTKETLGSFPEFSAACVACGCRQRDAQLAMFHIFENGAGGSEAILKTWGEFDEQLLIIVVSYWFGHRALSKWKR